MPVDQQWPEVNQAFSKQSSHFDVDDSSNPVLPLWRKRIYQNVENFLKPHSFILELNSGTGIDAIHFASKGHRVHATDLSGGMIETLQRKVTQLSLEKEISIQQVSFENLNQLNGEFDFVFSNFGGLNCTSDLKKVTRHLPSLLKAGGVATWVIMPRFCPWEWLWLLKGKFKMAGRRWMRTGAPSHLEGHYFLTYYFSLSEIKMSLPEGFQLIKCESLGFCAPPPAATQFVKRFPGITRFLNRLDQLLSSRFPFNRWGDHLIVTFKKIS
jgi:ubiquinone/menaquinone biosynthesis C-methylase UbiE